MIPLARVKLGAAARTSLAAERSADGAPSLGATLALVDGALLVPQSTMHLMGIHAGQRVWVTDEARSWHALVHLWPADKLVKTGCRLLLPSHDSSPLQDGSRALVQPLLQPIYRATAVHLRPLANSAAAAPLLRDQGAISSKLRQLVTLLLSTVLASRDVFVGDEVCVAQFEQEFTFRVTAVTVPMASAPASSSSSNHQERERLQRCHSSSQCRAARACWCPPPLLPPPQLPPTPPLRRSSPGTSSIPLRSAVWKSRSRS